MKFSKTTLPNGLRLILVPMQDNKTVTAMVLVEAGSRFESKENNGISHFLEHMCFKGTKKRPSALAISTEFESMGAHHNAFTSGTYTGYYGKVSSDKAEKILEMVSDLYLNATLPEKEIEKEKGVVIEEINMNLDKPQRIVWDVLDELAYGNHPLGRTVLGTKETVKSLTEADLESYRKEHYVPAKTVVTIAGKFDENKMRKAVKDLFGKIRSSKVKLMKKVKENQTAPQNKIYFKGTDQSHLVIGFRSFDRFQEKKVYAASILRIILGGGMSSRLFQRLREDLGLCYYIGAGQRLEQDCGMFTISAGVSNSKIEEAIKEIINEVRKILKNGPTNAEIKKAKDYKLGSLYLGLETSDQLADWYAFQEIEHDQLQNPLEYEENIKKVTKEQIMKVAEEIFKSENANLAIVGPHKDKNLSDWIKI